MQCPPYTTVLWFCVLLAKLKYYELIKFQGIHNGQMARCHSFSSSSSGTSKNWRGCRVYSNFWQLLSRNYWEEAQTHCCQPQSKIFETKSKPMITNPKAKVKALQSYRNFWQTISQNNGDEVQTHHCQPQTCWKGMQIEKTIHLCETKSK